MSRSRKERVGIVKMKVKVSDLKAAIFKHVRDAQQTYEKELAAYEEKQEKARKRLILNVEAYLKALKSGDDDAPLQSYERNNLLDHGVHFGREPQKPSANTDLIAKLNLSTEPIITVDDRSEYMRFLSGKCVC